MTFTRKHANSDSSNVDGFTYRLVEFNRSGSTSYTFGNDYDELCDRLDCGVDSDCMTGGDIDTWVAGIGWVVVDVELDYDNDDDCYDDNDREDCAVVDAAF